ncbi:MAG: PCRF domain-containing protein, partial [Ignavibacteriales bacterium]|nr:PCRF domain-containing protein [Ignavibacteriales bacterium]
MNNCGGFFDVEGKEKQVAELESKTTAANFWNDNVSAQKVMQQISQVKTWLDQFSKLKTKFDDIVVLEEMVSETNDEMFGVELQSSLTAFEKQLADLELRSMLSGVDDSKNAILTIHAGAGGTEAQDWAQMLLRMYLRWCERNGYVASLVDELEGDGAGIKSATIEVIGLYAFGYLKAESGVHRL